MECLSVKKQKHLAGVDNLHQDEELNQDSHNLLCVYTCYRVCIGEGTGLKAKRQGGYNVTAHVHSPPSAPASLCMFNFFPCCAQRHRAHLENVDG